MPTKAKALAANRELSVLRLAATAADVRKRITQAEIKKAPSLAAAFAALDAVWEEMGWGPLGARTKKPR
jgi:hypothetical protein